MGDMGSAGGGKAGAGEPGQRKEMQGRGFGIGEAQAEDGELGSAVRGNRESPRDPLYRQPGCSEAVFLCTHPRDFPQLVPH